VSNGSSTFLGGDAIGISKNSKHAAEAWNFLSWLMTEKAQKTVFADNNDTASNFKVLENDYTGADPRTLIGNATVKTGKTPIAQNFNTAFNAAGSPWQILIQDAIWGDASKIKADNDAITAALGG
jgi:multiple sugar transport system substrate-binding protein